MTRLIGILAGKGGVGKTTLVSNLAAALADFGEDVIAVDTNLTTPNLGLHLGMHLVLRTLHDVIRGDTRLKNVIYPHPSGFKVIPASLSVEDLKGVDVGRLPEITLNLLGKADYVLLDCAPGLGREAMSGLNASNEILLVTNPDLPSVTDALKTVKIAREANIKITGVVVNRVRKRKHELSKETIEEILDVPIIAEIPEDRNILKAVAEKKPLVHYDPTSPASIEIKKLAAKLSGREYKPPKRNITSGLITKLVDWLLG